MPYKRVLLDKTCPVCRVIFKPRVNKDKYCSKDCYYKMKKLRGDRVTWTEGMRDKLSRKYTGKGNPAYGKPSPLRGKKRPELSGKFHPMYKGGWIQNGYKYLSIDGRDIAEHRYLMEQHLGRNLKVSEVVHHINEDKLDNRIDNLQIMTRAEHMNTHRKDILKQ